jgi:hypothetical protein
MDLDFFLDENDRMWLFHIDNMVIKNNNYSSMTKKITGIKKRGLQIIERIKDKMISDQLIIDDDEFK